MLPDPLDQPMIISFIQMVVTVQAVSHKEDLSSSMPILAAQCSFYFVINIVAYPSSKRNTGNP